MALYLLSAPRKRYPILAGGIVLFVFLIAYNLGSHAGGSRDPSDHANAHQVPQVQEGPTQLEEKIYAATQPYILENVPSSGFGEMGRRTEVLTGLMQELELKSSSLPHEAVQRASDQLEKAMLSLYPFLRNPRHTEINSPLAALRSHCTPGSKGIVIPAGKDQFRFALHLIGNIRDVLGSRLEIQVAYAGDEDLPIGYRKVLESTWADVETVNVLHYFDDKTLNLHEGGWAIKPFAMLASRFEQVLMVDADAVFVQKPDVIFDQHEEYQTTGALLFHDRLLWQNVFKDRARWWRQEMGDREPSDTLKQSKVWIEGYAEEGDSGVIAFDKGRLPVLMALLHICWQNSAAPREAYTYKQTYGDKETYWFGLELCRVPFVFEAHYGASIGTKLTINGEEKVCGFVIAHVDQKDRLLWYNGSLLKNKAINKKEFMVPDSWMIDAEWQKGATKSDMSCMRGGQVRSVPSDAVSVIHESIVKAKERDVANIDLIGSLD